MTAVGSHQRVRLLPADGGADALEEELIAVGRAEKLFARTPDAQADAPSWVCFEGPPTARLAREEAGVTVRQPLSALVCVVPQHLAGDEGVLFEDLVIVRRATGALS